MRDGNNDELLIDVLRAAGHEDAAELASKLMAPKAAPAEDAAAVTPRAPSFLNPPATQADLEAESAYVLDGIKRLRAGR